MLTLGTTQKCSGPVVESSIVKGGQDSLKVGREV